MEEDEDGKKGKPGKLYQRKENKKTRFITLVKELVSINQSCKEKREKVW